MIPIKPAPADIGNGVISSSATVIGDTAFDVTDTLTVRVVAPNSSVDLRGFAFTNFDQPADHVIVDGSGMGRATIVVMPSTRGSEKNATTSKPPPLESLLMSEIVSALFCVVDA